MVAEHNTCTRTTARCLSSSTWRAPTAEDVAKYNDEGFLVVKGVLNQLEVDLVTEAMLQNEAIVSNPRIQAVRSTWVPPAHTVCWTVLSNVTGGT